MPKRTTFHVGDTVRCVSWKTFEDSDRSFLLADEIKIGDRLKITSIADHDGYIGQIGLTDKSFYHDPRNFKLVKRGKK